tara:strand:+ start:1305 stop:1886 length:582 start_codon:yes stop_codon:yes gene_type:complete
MLKRILISLIFTLFLIEANAKQFKSKYNFKFNLPDGYQLFSDINLFQVYDHSNKNPLIKKQLEYAKKKLQNQDIELLYNFSESPINNITILVFNNDYKVTKKNVLKQCKKILKIEKKFGKRKVNLKECRMHDEPIFANWSMYRENDSSYIEGAITQQIIFLFKKKEYVFTSGCWHKCNKTKDDLFNLVKSISF